MQKCFERYTFFFLDSILKTHERVRMCVLVSDVDPVCNYKLNGLERNPEPARDTWTLNETLLDPAQLIRSFRCAHVVASSSMTQQK